MDKTAKIRMKAKRNVTDLAGEKVMVDFEQGKYFCIKGVGNDIWDMLDGQEGEDGITVEAILHKLMEEYEVMEEVCEKEVLAFLDKLEQAGDPGRGVDTYGKNKRKRLYFLVVAIYRSLCGQDWSAVIVWAVGDFCLAGHGADHQGDH